MLDLIAGAAFDTTGNLRPVSKPDVFGEFMQPFAPDFPGEPVPTETRDTGIR
jgi:hypothetical protein